MMDISELLHLLEEAEIFVCEFAKIGIYCGYETGKEFSVELRTLHNRLLHHDWSALGSVVGIFAPTGAWDDGIGVSGMHIANRIVAELDKMKWMELSSQGSP
ncbi:MAG TPA: hypothetical protein VGL71_13895 [Urbifossiella sp.]